LKIPRRLLLPAHLFNNIILLSFFQIAIEGCGHGELDKIYETVQYMEHRDGKKVDLVLCCGDFQAVRNKDDLECMACPPKFRDMATFHKYYSGEKVAPYPTIFSK
jgi:lariat debranching enzyme